MFPCRRSPAGRPAGPVESLLQTLNFLTTNYSFFRDFHLYFPPMGNNMAKLKFAGLKEGLNFKLFVSDLNQSQAAGPRKIFATTAKDLSSKPLSTAAKAPCHPLGWRAFYHENITLFSIEQGIPTRALHRRNFPSFPRADGRRRAFPS